MLSIGPDQTEHEWGGRLCLALVNSILWRRSDAPIEVLTAYPKLVGLVAQAGWIPDPDALRAAAELHPRRAAHALQAAIDLREALFGLFSAVAAGSSPEPGDLATLNASLAESLGHLRLTDDLSAAWDDPVGLELPRWQAAASAGDLLTAGELSRVKQCPGERCGWVFVDDSRNRSRRWCEPNQCGNRERVRAHYRRSRAAG